MAGSMRRSSWWVWLVPTLGASALPVLALGVLASQVTGDQLFMLWGWFSALGITAMSVWTASRGISYSYWLGILSSVTGVILLLYYRMLWLHRFDFYENLHRIPWGLGNKLDLDIEMARQVGLLALAIGILFLIYDAIAQRRR